MNRQLGALDSYLAQAIFSDHKNPNDELVKVYAVGGTSGEIASGVTEDVWQNGGFYTYLSSASVLACVSDSAQDAPGGTGIKTIFIDGLDADYNPIQEFVTLNGVTPVNTVNSYLRCLQIFAQQSDNTDPNVGFVGDFTASAGATIQQVIMSGDTISRNSSRTIPSGYQGVITQGLASTVTNGIFTAGHFSLDFNVRRVGNIFATAISIDVASNTSVFLPFTPFLGRLPGKSDVKSVAQSLSSTSVIKVEYTLLAIRDDYFDSLNASI